MPLGTVVGLGPGNTVLDGDPAALPLRNGHSSPHFSVHVYCGRTGVWIKMLLGKLVDLVPGDTLLHGDLHVAPSSGKHSRPHFSANVYYCLCVGND